MSAASRASTALRPPLSAALGEAARRAVDHSHAAAQSARDLGQGGFRAAVLDRPIDPRPARRRARSGRGAPRLPRQRRQLPQGRPAAEGPEPGPRQRPADRRRRGLAPAAPLARAAVFAAPGRRIRARHAEGRRRDGRAPRPPPRRRGDRRRRTDVAHGARSAGADAVLAGPRTRAERIPAGGDELFRQLRTSGSARSPRRARRSCRGSAGCAAAAR